MILEKRLLLSLVASLNAQLHAYLQSLPSVLAAPSVVAPAGSTSSDAAGGAGSSNAAGGAAGHGSGGSEDRAVSDRAASVAHHAAASDGAAAGNSGDSPRVTDVTGDSPRVTDVTGDSPGVTDVTGDSPRDGASGRGSEATRAVAAPKPAPMAAAKAEAGAGAGAKAASRASAKAARKKARKAPASAAEPPKALNVSLAYGPAGLELERSRSKDGCTSLVVRCYSRTRAVHTCLFLRSPPWH